MKYAPITQTELKELFKKNIALDMDDLFRKTGSSGTTILRRLKEIGYLTSYNHNGKYFSIANILVTTGSMKKSFIPIRHLCKHASFRSIQYPL
jgi:hypothetical protein